MNASLNVSLGELGSVTLPVTVTAHGPVFTARLDGFPEITAEGSTLQETLKSLAVVVRDTNAADAKSRLATGVKVGR